jgi:hypothetical protein
MRRLLLFLIASVAFAANAPTIFFTDLQSGPNSGGEGGNGVYVTLYGKWFGATQGSSTVTVGGGAVAQYKSWCASCWGGSSGTEWDKVVIQLGSSSATGNIVMITSGGTSNSIAFTVRSGNIYCVSTGGSDSNPGTFAGGCWLTISHATNTIVAGDTVYVETITLTTCDPNATGGENPYLQINQNMSGASGTPKALLAYPGDTVTIGQDIASPSCSGGIQVIGTGGDSIPSSSVTIGTGSKTFTTHSADGINIGNRVFIYNNSNIADFMEGFVTSDSGTTLVVNVDTVGGSGTFSLWTVLNVVTDWVIGEFKVLGGPSESISLYSTRRMTVVGNEATATYANGEQGGASTFFSNNATWHGNNIHNISTNVPSGTVTALQQGFYLGDGSSVIEFGWNTIAFVAACRGFQQNSSTSPDTSFSVQIHDNLIHDTVCNGIVYINMDSSKGTGVVFYNNVLYNVGIGPQPPDGGNFAGVYLQTWQTTATGNSTFFNNTIYNCGTAGTAGASPCFLFYPEPGFGTITLSNNIIDSPSNSSPYIGILAPGPGADCTTTCTTVSGVDNVLFGQGAPPTYASITGSINSNPLFNSTSVPDFHLQSGSPAIAAGTHTGAPTYDLDGLTRPNPPSVGVFESVGSGPTPTNTITNLRFQTPLAGQIVFSFNVPSPTQCTVTAYSDPAFTVPIDDTNTILFSGSNACNRSSSVINGNQVQFVLGTRISSRMLPANTPVYVMITDTLNGFSTQTSVTTGNLPVGGTQPIIPPFCTSNTTSTAFGNYCLPDINWTNQAKQYVDPMTGVVIKRVTSPGLYGAQRGMETFDYETDGSGWTNPANILNGSGCTGTTSTCAQTANTNKLFLAMSGVNFRNDPGDTSLNSAGFSTRDTYDDFLVALTGACSSSTSANCVVNICLTYFDSHTCNTATQQVTVPSTTGTSSIVQTASTFCTSSPCAVTTATTGTGNLLYVGMSTSNSGITISSISGGGTWVHPGSCSASEPTGGGGSSDVAYMLSSTSGTTTVSVTLSGAPGAVVITFAEVAYGGSMALDVCGTRVQPTAATSVAGVALTLTGTNDIMFQVVNPAGSCSSVSGSYTAWFNAGAGSAYLLNTTSGTAPTWTCTSGTAALSAIAFKESSGGVGTVGFPAAGVGCLGTSPCTNQWSPVFQFGEWGGTPPVRADFGEAYGNVNTSGTAVTLVATTNSYNYFNTKIVSGAYIKITGSGCSDGGTDICKISSVTDPEHLTLVNPSATLSGAAYNMMASGALIWKNNTTGTVTIGASYAFAFSALWQVFSEGDMQACNPVSVPVGFQADGVTAITPPVPGNFCFFPWQNGTDRGAQGGGYFLLIPSTGEVRFISPLPVPPNVDSGDASGDQNSTGIKFAIGPWDGVSGYTIYGTANATSTGAISVYQGTYNHATYKFKAYSHPLYPCGTCFAGGATPPGYDPSVGFPGARWSDDPLVYTNITKPSLSKDPVTQIAALNPQWDSQLFSCSSLDRVVGGYAVIPCGVGQQDGFTTVNAFQLSTGTLTGVGDSFSTYPGRVCGDHSSFVSSVPPGYYALSCNPPTGSAGFVPGVNTTIPGGVGSVGSVTVTPASMGGIKVNGLLLIDTAGSLVQEQVTVTATTSTTFTANFNKGHAANVIVVGASTPMYSPYQITPKEMFKSGAFSTDTSMTTSAPLDNCSLYTIPAYMIALGATGNRCVKIRTQDVVSHYPATVHELAKWTSPQKSTYSQPFNLAIGDQIVNTASESDAIASVTSVTDATCGTQCVELVLVRGLTLNQGGVITLENISTGWTAYAVPPLTGGSVGGYTPGAGLWAQLNASNLNTTWLFDAPIFAGHIDCGTAPTTGNITCFQAGIFNSPYHVRYNQSLAAQAGTLTGANVISANAPFNGIAPSFTMQSYPSNEQYNAPQANEHRWSTDFHHASPSLGSSSTDAKIGIDAITYSLVAGTSNTYLVSSAAGGTSITRANYKSYPVTGYAGRYLLQDISGTSSAISDSTPYAICTVLVIGECRGSSTVGSIYVTVPSVPAIEPTCYTNWLTESFPCAQMQNSNASWLVQMDGSQPYSNQEFGRRITTGLSGIGRQYQFNTFIPESTGNWGFFKADWADGIRSEVFMAKLPPFPAFDSTVRYGFINYPVGGSCSSGDTIRVAFGYAENGAISNFYATPRAETTYTSASPSASSPFLFAAESQSYASCSGGKWSLNVPFMSQRVGYYQIHHVVNGVELTGPTQAIAVQ